METKMFIHEKCCAVKMDKIPNDVMERLLLRQNDPSSTFKHNLVNYGSSWMICLIVVFCIEFLFALPSICTVYLNGIIWDWVEHPILTFLPFLAIVGIWINELIIRDHWMQMHNSLKKQVYITPMYLVNITSYKVIFYPLTILEDVKTKDIYKQNDFFPLNLKPQFSHSSSTFKFKDGSFFYCSFGKQYEANLMLQKINEFRNIFTTKYQNNDFVWLTWIDDFKSLYEKGELLKNTETRFFDKIDWLFLISNFILAICMAIGMKMLVV